MTISNGISLSDLLNCASAEGVEEAITRYGLEASAAEPLNAWLQAEEQAQQLEAQARQAELISEAIADRWLAPLFRAAMEAA